MNRNKQTEILGGVFTVIVLDDLLFVVFPSAFLTATTFIL